MRIIAIALATDERDCAGKSRGILLTLLAVTSPSLKRQLEMQRL